MARGLAASSRHGGWSRKLSAPICKDKLKVEHELELMKSYIPLKLPQWHPSSYSLLNLPKQCQQVETECSTPEPVGDISHLTHHTIGL